MKLGHNSVTLGQNRISLGFKERAKNKRKNSARVLEFNQTRTQRKKKKLHKIWKDHT